MATKKHYFTKNNERIGKKSGKPRGKYKKQAQAIESLQTSLPSQKAPDSQLPNIPQTIAEASQKFRWQKGVLISFLTLVALLSAWQGIILIQRLLAVGNALEKRNALVQQMTLWENISKQYPTYRDAYF